MKNSILVLFLGFFVSVKAQNDKLLWLKTFNNQSPNNSCLGVDKQGNIYLAIDAFDSIDMDLGPDQHWLKFTSKSAFSSGIAIGKYSNNGDLIWAGAFHGDIPAQGLSLSFDDEFNVYFSGRFEDTVDIDPSNNVQNIVSKLQMDFFVVKLNSSGNFMWFKQFGSDNLDFLTCSISDSKGNLYLTGNFRGSMDFDPGAGTDIRVPSGSLDLFLIKLNNLGEYQWGIQYGGFQSSGNTVSLDPYENVVLSGQSGSNSNFNPLGTSKTNAVYGNRDFFVARYTPNGELINSFTGGGLNYDLGMAVKFTKNDGIFLFGNFRGTATFDAFNSSMDMTSENASAHFMARYDTTGKCLWRMQVPITGSEFLYYNSILPDEKGHVYVTETFYNSIDMDPSNDSLILNSRGLSDVFLKKMDIDGNLLWAKQIGSPKQEDIYGMCLDHNGRLILLGIFSDSCVFDFDSIPLLKSTGSNRNVFLLKYGEENSNQTLDIINSKIAVYPNPTSTNIYISGVPQNSLIKIYNSIGVELMQFNLKESDGLIDTSGFISGNYLMVIESNGVMYTRKIIINR